MGLFTVYRLPAESFLIKVMEWRRRGGLSGRESFSILISFALQGLFGLSLVLTMFGRMIIRSVYEIFKFDESIYLRLLNISGPSVTSCSF